MSGISKSVTPWVCLVGSLIPFLLYLAWQHPTRWFGRYGDDAAYFSSAKSLAEGRGYVIPSLPGEPPQTKYPVLYPWLLSWIWKWNPSFPSNVRQGVCLTAFFSCCFLAVAFQLLRKLRGVGDWPAFAIVVFCAFNPHFLFFSGTLLSDLPFMALAFASALAADNAMRADSSLAPAAWVGVVAGLSVMIRTVGVAVLAGILAAALLRRAFRQGATSCLGAALILGPSLWAARRSLAHYSGMPAFGSASTLAGWQQTLLYSTSYLRMWRFCVPNLPVFLAMLRTNLEAAILAPATYWLSPTLNIGQGLVANALGAMVGALSLAGILRQCRSEEWKPLHFIFIFYLALIVAWNYPIMERFLLLFLPIFLMGLWVEARHLGTLALSKLRSKGPVGERVLAAAMIAGLGVAAGIAAWNYAFGHRLELRELGREQSLMASEKLQVYDWIRQHTAPGDVIVADGDVILYLYTGRKAVIPIAFSTEYLYTSDRRVLDRDMAHITDTACAVGARYWLTAADDFQMELPWVEARERIARLMEDSPEVSRSSVGRVRLYAASSICSR